MTRPAVETLDRLSHLRGDFDRSFAEAPAACTMEFVDLLAVRVAGDAFALRTSDVAALVSGRTIVPLPSASPEFLGVLGFRGRVVPAYGLRMLLGYPRGAASRWAVLTGTDGHVALAFDEYDGYLRIPCADATPPVRAEVIPHAGYRVRHAGAIRTVLTVSSILESITRRAAPRGPLKEQ